jgi:hypothetical protein
VDRSMFSREDSVVVKSADELAQALATFGVNDSQLGDPRDCACPI